MLEWRRLYEPMHEPMHEPMYGQGATSEVLEDRCASLRHGLARTYRAGRTAMMVIVTVIGSGVGG